jgi:hypothetical protein
VPDVGSRSNSFTGATQGYTGNRITTERKSGGEKRILFIQMKKTGSKALLCPLPLLCYT